MGELITTLTEQPGLTILFSVLFGLAALICTRSLLGSLLKMHRSKTAVKKIEKQYFFAQRFLLHHVRDHCVHAKKFCRRVIVLHHANLIITLLVCITGALGCILHSFAVIAVYALLVQFFVIVLPVTVLEFALVKHPFRKVKGPYRFTDHHNTDDHESLF